MKSNSVLENLFSTEVMKWRYFKSLLVSFSLQLVVSTIVCSAIHTICFEVTWNPLTWIYYFILGIIQPYWIFRITIPALCYVVFTRIHVHSYEVCWWVPERRLQYIFQFSQPRKILYGCVLALLTSFLFQYYVYMAHPAYSSLTVPCIDSDKMCVNHQAVLVWLFGLAFGFRFSYKYFLQNFKSIQLGVAEPSLLAHIKAKLELRSVVEACSLFDVGFQLIASIYVAYGLLGGIIARWLSTVLGISEFNESYPVWLTFSLLMDVRFFATLVICLILLSYNLHCFLSTFQKIVSERIKLPLNETDSTSKPSEIQNSSPWTLSNALVSSCGLLQLFAFRQLKEIAMDRTAAGSVYRSQIFAISRPGGHPRNWQGVINPSLNLIRNFCGRLRQVNGMEDKSAHPSMFSTATNGAVTDVNKNDVAKEPSYQIKNKMNLVKEKLAQYPIFCYLLAELPDSRNRRIFAESQVLIWAVEGVSNLVAASYNDDQYGVVQKNIADILTALVQLQMVVDKVGRGLPYRRVTQGTNFGSRIQKYPHDLQLRRSLRLTLRSSLYVITNTFRDSIREIPVEAEVSSKLQSYLNFQEG